MSRLLALLLVLAITPTTAQEDDPGTAADNTPVGARSAGDRPQNTPPQEENTSTGDPFDYESSEQISEDLSVSFPVDI